MKAKNICRFCGGRLVKEYIGNYGDVYYLKENGEPTKKRLKRYIYEHGGEDEAMIYCLACGRTQDEEE